MPDMASGMVIQTRIEYELYGSRDLTVWHWKVTDTPTGVDMFEFLKLGLNAWLLAPGGSLRTVLAEQTTDLTLTGVVGQVIHPTRYRAIRTAVGDPGLQAFEAGTNNTALSIGWGGDLAGRGRSGRTQVPGVPLKWMEAGEWDVSVITAIADAYESVRVGPQTPTGYLVQLKPVLFSPSTGTTQDITTIQPYDTVRTMRRRTNGVGQ